MRDQLRTIPAEKWVHLVTVVPDNERYQWNELVQTLAMELGIRLLFRPSDSPNRNRIERLWRIIKRTAVSRRYHPTFAQVLAAPVPMKHPVPPASRMASRIRRLDDLSCPAV